MKKRFSILLIFMIFVLISCQKNEVEKPRVSFVSDGQDVDKNTPASYIAKAINDRSESLDTTVIVSNENKYATHLKNLSKKDGLIITNGFLLDDILKNVSANFENSYYVGIDTVINEEQKNISSIMFRTNESSFLVGYIAALTTKTDQIGYLGMESNLISDMYEYGFKSGVLEGAKELGKEINLVTIRVNDISNFEEGKKIADKLYKNGIDIIYQTAGLTGMGVIQSAKNNDKYVIGYDIDQSYLSKENVLTSSVKEFEKITSTVIDEYLKNRENLKNRILGLSEGYVSITPYNEDSILEKSIYDKAIKKAGEIVNKNIDIPLDKETYQKYLAK